MPQTRRQVTSLAIPAAMQPAVLAVVAHNDAVRSRHDTEGAGGRSPATRTADWSTPSKRCCPERRGSGPGVSAIFAQTSPEAVRESCQQVTASFENSFPKIAAMLNDAEADLTAFAAFPIEHWRKRWSSNPMERMNRHEMTLLVQGAKVCPNRAVTLSKGAVRACDARPARRF